MTPPRTAIVLGGSGSVGSALLHELLTDPAVGTVLTLTRRPSSALEAEARARGRRLVQAVVSDMTPASLAASTLDALAAIDGEVTGFSVLGIGAGTARLTIDEHRAVDVALNAAFARALRESGKVRHLAFMSAVGANPAASPTGGGAAGRPRYNRVKGESEEAVRAVGPPVVTVFRPAMIIGSQHTPWLLETVLPWFSLVTPAKFRSISVTQIAKAMVASAVLTPATSQVCHYPEMMALIAGRAKTR